MKRNKFTAKERAYLLSLPAVESVTKGRIFYSDEFRKECMRRYNRGESPARIFNEAGLYSSLIGYKRIERCIARWREGEFNGKRAVEDGDPSLPPPTGRDGDRGTPSTGTTGHTGSSVFIAQTTPQTGEPPAGSGGAAPGSPRQRTPQDVSGLMLIRYESRLRSLEKQIEELKEQVDRLKG